MAKTRTHEIAPGITVDPQVRFGRPVIKGTRVPVTVILEQLSLGATAMEVAEEYGVTEDDVLAVLRYAYEVITAKDAAAG